MAHLTQVALLTHTAHLTQNSSLLCMALLTHTLLNFMALLTQTPKMAG